MPPPADQRRTAAVEHALRSAALAILARDLSVADGVALVTAALAAVPGPSETPREQVTAARHARRAQMLAEMARHQRDGRCRAAAMLTARKFASDPLDPIEVEALANKLRRWRRRKTGTHRLRVSR